MACCSREAFVSLCTEGTQHELLPQYCGECHIYEKRDLGLDFSTGSSPYFFLYNGKTTIMKAVNQGHWLACVMKSDFVNIWMLLQLRGSRCPFQSTVLSKCFDKQCNCFWTTEYSEWWIWFSRSLYPLPLPHLHDCNPYGPSADTYSGKLYGYICKESGSLQQCGFWTEAIL